MNEEFVQKSNQTISSQPKMSIDKLINDASNTVTHLASKYANNDYMLQRLYLHIVNYLPSTLENECKNYQKRIDRNIYLTNEQQIFVQVFLSKNKYYFLHSNGFFYEYNGKNYKIVKEDDILHKLLSTISSERKLLEWKHKTKFNILKQIKMRSLFTSIPESDTIQNVLNLLHPFFLNKSKTKYFLTIIGDNIHKKNTHLTFLISQNMKKLIYDLNGVSCITIGNTNTCNNFITKYHDVHSYSNCRILSINEQFSLDMWKELLKKYGLDILCVASHYSNRYESSDNYIDTKADDEFKNYVYYLKNNTLESIIKNFLETKLQYISENINGQCNKIDWKHLHFIWKQYLSGLPMPNTASTNNLKNAIIAVTQNDYDKNTDCLMNYISRFLPIESDFIQFWEKTIVRITNTNTNTNTNSDISFENELEMDELCMLFKIWVKNSSEDLLSNGNMNEDYVIKILRHFFPDVEIIDDKYILNTSCIIWNKNGEIDESLSHIKSNLKEINIIENSCVLSFDDIYQQYCKFCNSLKKYVVSKRYFEKYLQTKLNEFVVYEKFIDNKWLLE